MIGVIGMIISLCAVPLVSFITAPKRHFGDITGMKQKA